MSDVLVSPSLLSADFANIQRDVEMLNESKADFIHIDIMDGVFVPNISFGFSVTKAVLKYAKKPMDFHLMIINPDHYLEACVDSGAEIISVHFETCNHLHRTVSRIRELGAKAGVTINPHTPVTVLDSILPHIDLVLVMSVNPGYGGQKFIGTTYEKISQLRNMADRLNPDLIIEVDGGVNLETGAKLVSAGANMLVAGNFVFTSPDPPATIESLKNL